MKWLGATFKVCTYVSENEDEDEDEEEVEKEEEKKEEEGKEGLAPWMECQCNVNRAVCSMWHDLI